MAKTSLDRLAPLVHRGIKDRRAILDRHIVSGRVSLPAHVLAALDSADTKKTDFDHVVDLLDTEDREDRIAVALCIEKLANAWDGQSPYIRDKFTRPRLRAALDDKLREVQRHVIRTLAKVHFVIADDALPLLVKKLHEPIADIQHAALKAIQSYGVDLASPVVKEIAVLLESPIERLKIETCRVLATFGDEASDAIPSLLECLQGATDSKIRTEVAKTLVAIDTDGVELSRQVDGELRRLLIAELRRLGPPARSFRRGLEKAWAACEDAPDDGMPGYTKEELGTLFGRDRRTIDRWIKSGRLPVVRRRGNLLFVNPLIIDQFRASLGE